MTLLREALNDTFLAFFLDQALAVRDPKQVFQGLKEAGQLTCSLMPAQPHQHGPGPCLVKAAILTAIKTHTDTANAFNAFTGALGAEEEGQSSPPGISSPRAGTACLAVVKLLQAGLLMPSPSPAPFLLGFNLRKGVSRLVFILVSSQELAIKVPKLHKILASELQAIQGGLDDMEHVAHGLDNIAKRQGSVDFTVLYHLLHFTINVMNNTKTKFEVDGLTSEQKVEATRVITKTHTKHGTFSFNMLELEQGHQTSQGVRAVRREYKESDNMTGEQNTAVQDLAQIMQILIIQGSVNVFNHTALLGRPTFITTCFFQTPRSRRLATSSPWLLPLLQGDRYSAAPLIQHFTESSSPVLPWPPGNSASAAVLLASRPQSTGTMSDPMQAPGGWP